MSEQIESDPWQQLPRVNRSITCFRVVLWLLPSGFAGFSAWAGDGLIRHHYLPDLGVGSWWVANALFVLGTGWFNALLSFNARDIWHGVRNRIILFVLIQPFMISFFVCLAIGRLYSGGE